MVYALRLDCGRHYMSHVLIVQEILRYWVIFLLLLFSPGNYPRQESFRQQLGSFAIININSRKVTAGPALRETRVPRTGSPPGLPALAILDDR